MLSLWEGGEGEGERGAAAAQGVVVSSSWEGEYGAAVTHEVLLLEGNG